MGRPEPISARELWQHSRIGAPSVGPDGDVIYSKVVCQENAPPHSQLIQRQPDGNSRGLTASDGNATGPVHSPDGSQVAFLRKPGPEEKPQLFVMSLTGGEPRQLTQAPLGVSDPRWHPTGASILVVSEVYSDAPDLSSTRDRVAADKERKVPSPRVTEDRLYRFWDQWLTDGKVPHLFSIDVETAEARDLIPDSRRWFGFMSTTGHYDISPDGSEVAFAANSSEPPHDRIRWAIFTVPFAGGPVECVTPDNPAGDDLPRYSPDGRWLFYRMRRQWDFYADRPRLVRIDRSTNEHTVLTEEWDASVEQYLVDGDSTHVYLLAGERARTSVFRMSCTGGSPERLATGGSLHSLQLAPDNSVYFVHASLTEPPELARLAAGSDTIERIPAVSSDLSDRLGRVEEIDVVGSGGQKVQTFVVYPPEFDPGKKWPLLQMIHGGPHGVSPDGWSYRWNPQLFAAQGYVVALVNFHGSTTFGEEFAGCIQGSWGDQPADDILAATDELVDRGFIDSERMAISGGSYGGYLVTWLTTLTNRFRCAICHAGVIDFAGMYAGDVSQGRERSQGGAPWNDRSRMDQYDPIRHIEKIETPTLIFHGEKDYRVPATQGLQLYGMLKSMQIESRLVYYPTENHWILNRENSIHWVDEFSGWLERFLSPCERN